MDLEFQLRSERSKSTAIKVAEYLLDHPAEFNAYLSLLESDEKLLHQRPAVRRNIMRIFQYKKLEGALLEKLISLAFSFLQDPSETTTVRVYSMQALYTNCRDYQQLLNELKLILKKNTCGQAKNTRLEHVCY
jgi:hypothetical protein